MWLFNFGLLTTGAGGRYSSLYSKRAVPTEKCLNKP